MNLIRWAAPVALAILASISVSSTAFAVDVSGIKVDEKAKVAGADLVLNGSGIRYAFGGFVRVYVASLYLPQKRATSQEIAAMKGPRRVQLNLLREVTSDDFAKGLMGGLRSNLVGPDKVKHFESLQKLGAIFGQTPALKKGDVVLVDSVVGTGTTISVNGKRVGEVFPDETFFDAILQIWIGPSPIDKTLKPVLLGVQASNDTSARNNDNRY
jgi:hypothetical protein